MSPRLAASLGMKVLMIQLLVVEITEAQPFGLLEAKIYVRESRLEVHWLASADSLHPPRFVQRATQILHWLAVVPLAKVPCSDARDRLRLPEPGCETTCCAISTAMQFCLILSGDLRTFQGARCESRISIRSGWQ